MKKWNEIDGIWCRDMYAAGKPIKEIAIILGRSRYSVEDYLRRHEIARDRQNRALATWRDRVDRRGLLGNTNAPKRAEVPLYVLAERDKRANERSAMSAAQIICGDPPPSQSALARVPREPGLVQSRESLRD